MENYRVPAGAGIGHVHLKVADIDRAIAFYTGVLGFDQVMRLGDHAAFVSAGGYHHHIGLNTWQSRRGTPAPPASYRPVSLRHSLPDAPRSRTRRATRHRCRRAPPGRRRSRRQRVDLPGRSRRQRHRADARSTGIGMAARRRRQHRDAHGGAAGSGGAAETRLCQTLLWHRSCG